VATEPHPKYEVADILRLHGKAYKAKQGKHLHLTHMKVMSAIAACRSAKLGGHQLHCAKCETDIIAYNSCRNRHCPKCQSSSAKRWLEARQTQLLPIDYYHVVFTLPAAISELAYYNKAKMYDLLMKAAAQTLSTIAGDSKHLGAQIGTTMVLHTWGSAMVHHPHVHCIVPGGGISQGNKWQACKKGFFLPVRVLSRLFRRLFVEGLRALFAEKHLLFFNLLNELEDTTKFDLWCTNEQNREWVVYAKKPFAGPKAVLAYLARYTHRVAISNSRLREVSSKQVSFTYKDYRRKGNNRHRTMQLDTNEFIRRFMLHVLPSGFHRIRHFGLLASRPKLALARRLLDMPAPEAEVKPTKTEDEPAVLQCHTCKQPLAIMAIKEPVYLPRAPPTSND
jgi:hypothetical protein